MSGDRNTMENGLAGQALRNANLRGRSLARAREAPPLARSLVTLRAQVLGMTRMEFSRQSGISRGTLRDLEVGVHSPTRRILQRFVDFCKRRGVASCHLNEVYNLYAGADDGLAPLIARLELRAGSPGELARRVRISPATLWEYRRGNFPLPVAILRRLCLAVDEDVASAEAIWFAVERKRFLARGYSAALAEFWTLCSRGEYAEKHLASLGLGTAALRHLRYMELPAWKEIAETARIVCRDKQELLNLERLWRQDEQEQTCSLPDRFGLLVLHCRQRMGLSRREVADLFRVGGKKPARVIQSIEEGGCYSAQVHPAGLAGLLTRDPEEQARLLQLWKERRKQFHTRRRPETRVELRLARERYGFDYKDMEPILGYTSLEYQRIERGLGPLAETARGRILQAIHRAGQERVDALLRHKAARDVQRAGWRSPPTVRALVSRLAKREGGLVPLARHLRQAGETGFWAARLRAILLGDEVPAWPHLERIGSACQVVDLEAVRRDWREQYRKRLQKCGCSPLGAEVRLLIAEVATSVREFSVRLGFSPSVLVRDLQRMDRGVPGKWFHVERILLAAGVPAKDPRWGGIHAWWYSTQGQS